MRRLEATSAHRWPELDPWPGVTMDSLALNVALSTGVAADKALLGAAGTTLWSNDGSITSLKVMLHHSDYIVIIHIYIYGNYMQTT